MSIPEVLQKSSNNWVVTELVGLPGTKVIHGIFSNDPDHASKEALRLARRLTSFYYGEEGHRLEAKGGARYQFQKRVSDLWKPIFRSDGWVTELDLTVDPRTEEKSVGNQLRLTLKLDVQKDTAAALSALLRNEEISEWWNKERNALDLYVVCSRTISQERVKSLFQHLSEPSDRAARETRMKCYSAMKFNELDIPGGITTYLTKEEAFKHAKEFIPEGLGFNVDPNQLGITQNRVVCEIAPSEGSNDLYTVITIDWRLHGKEAMVGTWTL